MDAEKQIYEIKRRAIGFLDSMYNIEFVAKYTLSELRKIGLDDDASAMILNSSIAGGFLTDGKLRKIIIAL